MSRRFQRLAVMSLTMFFCSAVLRADDDLLDQARRRLDIERQRIEAEVRDMKSDAQRLAKTDPTAAADLLRSAISKLENDTTLATDRRESLLRNLKLVQAGLPKAKDTSSILSSEMRRTETERRLQDLSKPKQGDAASTARDIINRRTADVAANKEIGTKSNSKMLAAFNSIDKSAIPVEGEIEFPEDWAKRSMMRKKQTEPKLTPEEKAILKALDTVVAPDFKEISLQEFLDWVTKETGGTMTFVVSKQALDDAMIQYTSTVRIKGRATSRTMLRKVLADLGLTYVVKDNSILVTTPNRAKELMTTRTYYMGDLAGVTNVRWGPFINQQLMINNLAMLVETIKSTIDPLSWDTRGGAGSIAFHPATMTLIVRQSSDVHFLLGSSIK